MEFILHFFIKFIVVWCLYCNGIVYSQKPFSPDSGMAKPCIRPIVELTVSPLVSKSSMRELIISWDVGDPMPGDWIGLYNSPPDINNKTLFRKVITQSEGYTTTGICEIRRFPENPNFTRVCLGFWVAYWRATSRFPVTASCLSTNPTWMIRHKKELKRLRLKEIFLPGTHDSGAFYLAYSPFTETRYHKYVFAQDENILEQLIHGARYLDFRIGYYDGKFWLNHGPVKIRPLEYGLEEVKMFLNYTKEIVVLDFHNFPAGFKSNAIHTKFVDYLRKELKEYAAPPSLGWRTRLSELWNADKRLVISYNNRNIVYGNLDFLWWPVSQKWGDKKEFSQLHDYFVNVFDRSRFIEEPNGWAAMVELTPDIWDVLMDRTGGLRTMAHTNNPKITEWFRGEWGSLCNAVAVDFIRSSGIVNAAIKWNIRKGKRTSCDP